MLSLQISNVNRVFAAVFGVAVLLSCGGCSLLLDSFPEWESGEGIIDVIIVSEPFDYDSIQKDPFTITETRIRGNVLRLYVIYSGGCNEHEFLLYSTPPTKKTKPPGADVYLHHNGFDDACDAIISKEIAFDISPLKQTGLRTIQLFVHRYEVDQDPIVLLYNY